MHFATPPGMQTDFVEAHFTGRHAAGLCTTQRHVHMVSLTKGRASGFCCAMRHVGGYPTTRHPHAHCLGTWYTKRPCSTTRDAGGLCPTTRHEGDSAPPHNKGGFFPNHRTCTGTLSHHTACGRYFWNLSLHTSCRGLCPITRHVGGPCPTAWLGDGLCPNLGDGCGLCPTMRHVRGFCPAKGHLVYRTAWWQAAPHH